MSNKTVAVIFGGRSPEYGVSLKSAEAVLKAIDRKRYEVVMIGITKEGKWYRYLGEVGKIGVDEWETPAVCAPAILSPSRTGRQLLVWGMESVEAVPVDIVFPVLHGKNGEDGTLQGLVELAGLKLAGCGALCSALCMDKDRAHKIAAQAGVLVAGAVVAGSWEPYEEIELRARKLAYPLFVKPVRAGSSFGISKVENENGLYKALELAFSYDSTVILEQTIEGFEVGCAVLGNQELIVGEVDEVELEQGFFDFTEKYNLITSAIHVPARISEEKAQEIKRTAQTLYRALGCKGFARVDMFLTPEGEIYFNEINTIPGFTQHSRFPNMLKAAGMSFEQVVGIILELAV